jgi:nicotinamide-nucleotide amidase
MAVGWRRSDSNTMQAEIITIGTELLLGQIVDTNAAYLAQQLAGLGFNVYRKTTVGDNELRIGEAVRSALRRSDVVITSGGLGPTVDDKTREGVATATNRKLVLNHRLLEQIEAFFHKRGREVGENNRRQAYVPRNAIPIHNPVGTAPAFVVKHRDSYVISLPGVPRELRHLTEHSVLPFLQQELGLRGVIMSRILRTAGVGESDIDRQISDLEESPNPTVGLAAHTGLVDIRITARADDEYAAGRLLDEMEKRIRDRLGNMIYGIDEATIESTLVEQLRNQHQGLAVLETNTGGVIAARLTAVPGGLDVLNPALVTSLERATSWLLQPEDLRGGLTEHVAEVLAQRLRAQAAVNIGIAVVGDTDPAVGPYSEETGTTYMGLSTAGYSAGRTVRLGGISEVARAWIANSTLDLLRQHIVATGK